MEDLGVAERGDAAPARGGIRMTAEERRQAVLRAAVAEFARTGFAGTSTEAIAERAGISQPYLFRLFGTKKDLFIAAVDQVHQRIMRAFRTAADGLDGVDALVAMGHAYKELMEERDLLLLQLHGFAASSDPEVRTATRQGFRKLWWLVSELSGLPETQLRPFFAQGMLLTVMAAMEASDLDEQWAQASCEPDPEQFAREFLST